MGSLLLRAALVVIGVGSSVVGGLGAQAPDSSTRALQGLMAGAGLGALVFVALQLTDNSGLERGARARQGFTVILGAAAIGMLMDGISDPWVEQFPE